MKLYSRRTMLLVALTVSLLAASIASTVSACYCMTPTPTPSPTPVVTPTASVLPLDLDTSVSFNDSDLGVGVYKAEDADGNIVMEVYRVTNGGTESTYLFSITQADLAAFATDKPAVNTLLASADGVSVYILTTGEIQVSAGPDKEGKFHVKIFNGIPWTNVYGYTIDPQ